MSKIVIVGAGPAGVRAAQTLVSNGIRPILIDEGERSGGQIYRRPPFAFKRSYETLYGSEAAKARRLHDDFDSIVSRIEYRPNSLVWGLLGKRLHVVSAGQTAAIDFDHLILATGATDRVMPLPGWTLPGTFSLGASQIALKAQGCAIGSDTVFLGTGPLLYLVAYQYLKAGNPPKAVLDTSRLSDRLSALPLMAARGGQILKGMRYLSALRRAGVTMLAGIKPKAVLGDAEHGVTGVSFVNDGKTAEIACNAVGMGYHLRSETQLADLAGCRFSFDDITRQWFPDIDPMGRSSVDGVYLAGDGVRIAGADAAELGGQLAACALLADLGKAVPRDKVDGLLAAYARQRRFAAGIQKAFPWPAAQVAALPDETLICRCEAITAKDLRQAAGPLSAPEVNRAKAFSRVGMGRCQGRFCGLASQEIVSAARGTPVEAAGRLRGQAPVKPLSIATSRAENDNA